MSDNKPSPTAETKAALRLVSMYTIMALMLPLAMHP